MSVTMFRAGGTETVTAYVSAAAQDTSAAIPMQANTVQKFQIIMPGETAVPGSNTGKYNTPSNQKAGTAFTVTVNACDQWFNVKSDVNPLVTLTTTDNFDSEPSPKNLTNGSTTFSLTLFTASTHTVNASGIYTGYTTPDPVTVAPNDPIKLQVIMPGET